MSSSNKQGSSPSLNHLIVQVESTGLTNQSSDSRTSPAAAGLPPDIEATVHSPYTSQAPPRSRLSFPTTSSNPTNHQSNPVNNNEERNFANNKYQHGYQYSQHNISHVYNGNSSQIFNNNNGEIQPQPPPPGGGGAEKPPGDGSAGADNSDQFDSFYFDDGVRRVDFILAYKTNLSINMSRAELMNAREARKVFESNLIEEGLQLEYSTRGELGLHFVKIHAPWEVLIRYAEVMKFKMPMRQVETSWRLYFEGEEDDPYRGRFTVEFSRDKEYLFDIPPQREKFFSPSQRSQIVDFILKRKSFSPNLNDASLFGINKLLNDKVYVAAYPLHEGKLEYDNGYESPRSHLLNYWASVIRCFSPQPLDEIRKYFGVKIALYFAWLGFYTSMLIPASIVGLICFFYGWITVQTDIPSHEMCNSKTDFPVCPACVHDCDFTHISDNCVYAKLAYLFDNPATVFFAIFMSLWATVYLEMWKRYSARITHKWDLSNFDAFEEYPRPEYLAKLSSVEKKKLNVVTGMYEPYVPYWKKQLPYTILSVGIVFFLVTIALGSVVSVIVYRVSVRAALAVDSYAKDSFFRTYATVITAATAAGLNLLSILIFNTVYSNIAVYLTELEMPRTQTEFDNSLTLKMFLLQFVNYYSSIFYVAFFKGRFVGTPGDLFDDKDTPAGKTQEECSTGGCLLELAIQLAIIMVGKQALNAVMEMSGPWIELLFNKWWVNYQKRKNAPAAAAAEEAFRQSEDYGDAGPGPNGGSNGTPPRNIKVLPALGKEVQWEEDYSLATWGPQSLFYEYLEMVLQFGFVTIFVAAFPLAPFFALLNNILEIRLDAKKMITAFRRPVAQRVQSIGVWYSILDSIGKFSVITNAIVIAFTSDFIPRLYYYYETGSMEGYLNYTLSYYAIDDLHMTEKDKQEALIETFVNQTFCIYQHHRYAPWEANEKVKKYDLNMDYWIILAIRLSFVVVFENVIVLVTGMLRWLIPDVPAALRQQIRQHTYLTNELIMQQELKRAKDLGLDPGQDGGGSGNNIDSGGRLSRLLASSYDNRAANSLSPMRSARDANSSLRSRKSGTLSRHRQLNMNGSIPVSKTNGATTANGHIPSSNLGPGGSYPLNNLSKSAERTNSNSTSNNVNEGDTNVRAGLIDSVDTLYS